MSFPTAVTAAIPTTGTEVLGSMGSGTGLSGLLNYMGVDLAAVETKLGTGSSTPASNTILYGTGAGTSAWQGLTSAQLASILSDETGSGAAVFANSPTIVTPTVASFTNAQHNHTNAAGGGQLSNTSFATGTLGTDKLTNPYKFSVYLSSAQNSTNVAGKINFDAKTFDTGSNVDISVNKGRFTAPIAGIYYFTATATVASNSIYSLILLYKNGVALATQEVANASTTMTPAVSGLYSLSINDYIEVYIISSTTSAMSTGSTNTTFMGFLVSAT